MKILVDSRIWGSTGIQEYTRNLLRELMTIDHDNEYTLFYNSFRHKVAPRLGSGTDIINWGVPNKLLDFSARFFNWPAVDSFIKTDLIFSPHFNILAGTKVPRVITFHDLSFLHHPQFFSRKQKIWHWLQNVKKQARQADKIIAVSEFTKSDLINLLGIPEEKIKVVYSGISEEFKQETRRKKQEARPYILYLGTLEPRKNVPAIIRAFNIIKQDPNFKNWQLILAGRPGWLYQNTLKEIKNSPHHNDIILKGQVNQKERVALYSGAEMFVYPSFFEGFGFPPLEAQSCGCPAIVFNRASLAEVLGESALMVNPWKVEELSGAIKKCATDSNLKKRLIKSGHQNAKKFSWKNTAQETLSIFETLK